MNELAYHRNTKYREEIKRLHKMEEENRHSNEEKEYLKKHLYEMEHKLSAYEGRSISEQAFMKSTLQQSDIYRYLHSWQETDGNISQEKWDELRIAVDMTYPRFSDRLFLLYPQLSEQELRICLLLKIEIGIRTIALMLNKTTAAITNARARMNKKLRGTEGKAEDIDRFIAGL